MVSAALTIFTGLEEREAEPQLYEVEVFGLMSVYTTKMPPILFELSAIVNFACFHS